MTDIWAPIAAWLNDDPDIKAWLTDAELNVLKTTEDATLKLWKALTQYQGFDIKHIIRKMIINRKSYEASAIRLDTSIALTVNGKTENFAYTNLETMASDIKFLIFLFAARGSKWEKFTSKSYKEVNTIMDWMASKYQLDKKVNDPNAALGPDIITIPRIAACFPAVICDYFHKGYGKCLLTYDDLGLPDHLKVSASLLCPFTNAMIPSTWCNGITSPHIMFFLVHVIVDDVIHKKKEDYTNLIDIFSYYSASYNSPGTPLRSRVAFMTKIGFVNAQKDGFPDDLAILQPALETILSGLRPQDKNLKTVIKDLAKLK